MNAAEALHNLSAMPMSRFQIQTVVLCLGINLLDGFDVLAISFAAPQIAQEWSLRPQELGILFSAGLAGMVLASILLSGIADYIGRRRTILLSLATVTVGMFATAFVEGTTMLAVWRFVVGLGVGTILPSLNTLVAEFSSARRRDLAITTMQAGFPAGAVLGGIISVLVVAQLGWRGIFLVGGGLSLCVFLLSLRYLPESIDYLLTRQPPNALATVNAIRSRLGQRPLMALPTQIQATGQGVGYRGLLEPQPLMATVLLSAAFFFVMGSYYFVASWTPKLLVDAGLSLNEGISGGIVLSVGGILGGLTLGWLASRYGARPLTMLFMLATLPAMWLFPQIGELQPMLLAGFVMGFFLLGSMMGLYAITPSVFDARTRASATGVAVGLGRFGAITGPLATGYLLETGWTPTGLYPVFGLPLLLSMIAIAVLHRQLASQSTR